MTQISRGYTYIPSRDPIPQVITEHQPGLLVPDGSTHLAPGKWSVVLLALRPETLPTYLFFVLNKPRSKIS